MSFLIQQHWNISQEDREESKWEKRKVGKKRKA